MNTNSKSIDESMSSDVQVTEDDVVDRILSMVDLTEKPTRSLPRKNIPSGCWHQEGCDNIAVKQLRMNYESITLGHSFVSSQMKNLRHINQLCIHHFNDKEYDLQKKLASIILDI